MKLFYAPRSPFGIKVRILAHELGVQNLELVQTDPWSDETLRAHNPLCKIPTLALDDGFALYDSPVICEYLNALQHGTLVPASGRPRWEALRRQAVGDGIAEAVVRRFVERLGPVSERSEGVVRRQEAAIAAALDALEAEAAQLNGLSTIGEIAAAAALVYLSFRSPEIAWRSGRSHLGAWFDAASARPSMAATRIPAPEGR